MRGSAIDLCGKLRQVSVPQFPFVCLVCLGCEHLGQELSHYVRVKGIAHWAPDYGSGLDRARIQIIAVWYAHLQFHFMAPDCKHSGAYLLNAN